MDLEDYNTITKYIFNECGIVLGEDRQYLVEQRLESILGDLECRSFSDLAIKISFEQITYLIREKILNAMTINETSFFRDEHPYDVFRDKIMPDMQKLIIERKKREYQRRGPKVSLWSVAASTGQEAYSMAMIISDFVNTVGMGLVSMEDFGILGTDISSRVLAKAIMGKYEEIEVSRGLTPELLDRHFIKENKSYIINEEIRKIVEFKTFNIQEPFTQIGSFDVIFCRNILIYFTNDAKRKILSQLYQVLAPNGYLLLGSSENMYDLNKEFATEIYGATVVYRKK